MDISSFVSNQDLAGFIISLAVQSILISLFGIAVIKLLSIRSAPVRSLASTVIIAALGLVLMISCGFRLSDISWSQPAFPAFWEEIVEDNTLSNASYEASPAETIPDIYPAQPQSSIENHVFNNAPIPSAHSIELAESIIPVINILGYIWFMGLFFQIIMLGYGILQVKRFKKSLQPVSDGFYIDTVRAIAGTFWKNRIPVLCMSPDIESPVTIGLFNPVIIIPEKLFSTLRVNELKSILLHELAHIFHNDQFMGLTKRIVLALHWWNPLVYAINREHEQAREEVSDNYVLRELHPRVYTSCLVNLAEKVCLISNLPTAAGMAGRYFNLSTRVELILSKKRSVVMNTKMYLKIITFTTGLVLTLGIAGLHGKVSSKTPDDRPETRSTMDTASLFDKGKKSSQEIIEDQEQANSSKISKIVNTLDTASLDKPEKQIIIPVIIQDSSKGEITEKKVKSRSIDEQQKPETEISNNTAQETVQARKDILMLAMNDKHAASKGNKTGISGPIPERNKDISDAAEHQNSRNIDYFSRGKTCLEKGKTDKAISAFNKAIELNNKGAEIYLFRGKAYTVKNGYEQALNDYNRAIELAPEYAVAYNNRGFLFYKKQEYKRAIDDFRKAIKIKPKYYYAYLNRGNAYYMEMNFRKAISDYKKVIKINPVFSLAYINRGKIYYKYGRLNSAIKDFTRALELDGKDTGTYVLRGNAYRRKGKYKQAISDYNKAIAINPGLAAAYFNRGNIYSRKQQYDKAINDYNKILEFSPENIYAYTNRGDIYTQKQEYDKAIADYSKAIEIEPNFASAYARRRDAYHHTGQFEKEKNDKKMVAALKPRYPVHVHNAILYYWLDKSRVPQPQPYYPGSGRYDGRPSAGDIADYMNSIR
ncbi:MAG: tetratricopeptide repeat protein [Desulfobacteraceae bacterium]|jgi:tetratricopeptide (TPR) repeat protein/beta-lactamase regulating signal transducer with metallopeptidase domain